MTRIKTYDVGGEGDLGSVEDLLVDDNGFFVVVGLFVLGSSGQDGGGNERQGGDEGGGETHVGSERLRGGWIWVHEGKRRKEMQGKGRTRPFIPLEQ